MPQFIPAAQRRWNDQDIARPNFASVGDDFGVVRTSPTQDRTRLTAIVRGQFFRLCLFPFHIADFAVS